MRARPPAAVPSGWPGYAESYPNGSLRAADATIYRIQGVTHMTRFPIRFQPIHRPCATSLVYRFARSRPFR
ncbi:hypothetical protein BDI4_450038 [Burkholderia diffusa]|nr:hypothetical protein BDI4_450038 [Burkholderia diffusa]